jgi:SMP-30/Gluconolactonase/LRE-like region
MDNELHRPNGSLYRVTGDGQVARALGGVIVTNGIAFSPDNRTLYFTDTRRYCTWTFDEAAAAAGLAAQERFAREPIPQTGQGAWKQLYRIARQFAAEAGVRGLDEAFQQGDPYPVCQRDLDDQV